MTDKQTSSSPGSQASGSGEGSGAVSRRSLLRAGLGATPVVLSVASQPVMATTGRCSSASAFGSINASRPSQVDYCGGCKPQYWKATVCHPRWPSGYRPVTSGYTPATMFDECFGSRGGYYGKSLLWVLQTTGTGKDEVARHCAAALLNAAKGLTPPTVLSVQTVKNVWGSYVRRGYYEPTAGIRWYAHSSTPAGNGGIVEWLVSTMPISNP
jgi:hypothetical protein